MSEDCFGTYLTYDTPSEICCVWKLFSKVKRLSLNKKALLHCDSTYPLDEGNYDEL